MTDLGIGDWIGCIYDEQWYVGEIKDFDNEVEEVFVSFLQKPPKEGQSFIRGKKDICWIPIGRVLKKVNPVAVSSRREMYNLDIKTKEELDKMLTEYLKPT